MQTACTSYLTAHPFTALRGWTGKCLPPCTFDTCSPLSFASSDSQASSHLGVNGKNASEVPLGLPPSFSILITADSLTWGWRVRARGGPVAGGCVVCVLVVYFLRTPSRVPYGTPPACANRAAYPDPPPRSPPPRIHRRPGGLPWTALMRPALMPGCLRPELFPGIGVLPGPATESHVVNRGTPVAPLDSRS